MFDVEVMFDVCWVEVYVGLKSCLYEDVVVSGKGREERRRGVSYHPAFLY